MPIICGSCGITGKWCIWQHEEQDWICKLCFISGGGTYSEWEEAVAEAKERRKERLEASASGVEPIEYGTKTRTKPRPCTKGCGGTLIYWDDKLQGTNKFVEIETRLPHSFIRCAALKHAKEKEEQKLST